MRANKILVEIASNPADTLAMALLILFILIVPSLVTLFIKARIEFAPEPEIHFESELERTLNEAVADERFEASLQRTIVRKQQTRTANSIRSPEEAGYLIAPRRDRDAWQPEIPGVIHNQDQRPDW